MPQPLPKLGGQPSGSTGETSGGSTGGLHLQSAAGAANEAARLAYEKHQQQMADVGAESHQNQYIGQAGVNEVLGMFKSNVTAPVVPSHFNPDSPMLGKAASVAGLSPAALLSSVTRIAGMNPEVKSFLSLISTITNRNQAYISTGAISEQVTGILPPNPQGAGMSH